MRPVTDPEILALLDDCRQQMGVRSPVNVMATDHVNGPALFGLVRAHLLLSCRTLAEMDRNELRYIFLHELAHLKRHDILVGTLASVLQVLHWFNPLIAYGLQRMRAERELACDSLALSHLHAHETAAYGRTVIRLIEQVLVSRGRPLLTGFLGGQTRIKQRVAMISLFRRENYQWSPLALALVGLVACIGLTDGRAVDRPAQAPPEPVQPVELYEASEAPAAAPAYANIMKIYIRHRQTGKFLVAASDGVTCDADVPGDAGLWEVQLDNGFSYPNGDMLLYSVSAGKYLSSDDQGNLAFSQSEPDAWARWTRRSSVLGVQVISQKLRNAYVRLGEQGQVRAVGGGRGMPSQWDFMQLSRETRTLTISNR